jgi:hypothetical protein
MQIPLTPIALTALANVVMAGLFAIIPAWRAWFISRSADEQTALFGIGSIILGVILMAGTCAGLFNGIVCTANDLTYYFVTVVLSSIGGISSAKAAFVVVRLTDKKPTDSETMGRAPGIPHAERAKMLD